MSLVGPHVTGTVPGERSRAWREAEGRLFYSGQVSGAYPIVAARKDRWLVEDLDGNVFVDLVSSSASVPFGAGRRDIVDAVRRPLLAFGNEDSHALTNPTMLQLAERLLAVSPASADPGRHRAQRDRGDRECSPVHATVDRSSADRRISRRLPR